MGPDTVQKRLTFFPAHRSCDRCARDRAAVQTCHAPRQRPRAAWHLRGPPPRRPRLFDM